MSLNDLKILILIILTTLNVARGNATKCGDFFCAGKTDCKLSKEKDRLECSCEEGFVASITAISDEGGKCLKIGDKCGSEHKCNQDLVCEKINIETVILANENCLDGKCITEASNLNVECSDSQKCLDKCCAENEFCSKENVCLLKGNQNETGVCPESQKCQDKCCRTTEKCENGSNCITVTMTADRECPQEQICLKKCCPETEKCNENKECVAKEKLEKEVSWQCPEKQKCTENCCAENEICSLDNKCVARVLLSLDCPEAQKCLDSCCSLSQICSKNFRCEEQLALSVKPEACPLKRQCLDRCCNAEEKCSKLNTCIPIGTIECIETEICGDKCCPINETCNEDHECVAFLEATTIYNCPERQQCADNCCKPHEVCNESNVCVAKTVKKELLNVFNHMPPQLFATESSFEAPISCLEDQFVCQSKCCHHEQTCSSMGECLDDQHEVALKARNCEFEGNCKETESVNETMASMTYTFIGVGCLIMVLSFGLFKVYAFRRSYRIVYN